MSLQLYENPGLLKEPPKGITYFFLQTFFCVFITKGEVLQDLFRE